MCIYLPVSFLKKCASLILSFVWRNKPRISKAKAWILISYGLFPSSAAVFGQLPSYAAFGDNFILKNSDDLEPSAFPFFTLLWPTAIGQRWWIQSSSIEKEGDCAVSVRITKTKLDKTVGTVSLLCDKCGVTEESLSQLFWCGPRQFLEGHFWSFLNSLLGTSN